MDAELCSLSTCAMVRAAEKGQHPVEFCDNPRKQLTSWGVVDQYLTHFVTIGMLSGLEVKKLFEEQFMTITENPERC